jgi:hypothetical protein
MVQPTSPHLSIKQHSISLAAIFQDLTNSPEQLDEDMNDWGKNKDFVKLESAAWGADYNVQSEGTAWDAEDVEV